MSQTFSIVCHETKKRIWIGQGWGEMTILYYGVHSTMENLKRFLNDHIDKQLVFLCNDKNNEIYDYEYYDEEV